MLNKTVGTSIVNRCNYWNTRFLEMNYPMMFDNSAEFTFFRLNPFASPVSELRYKQVVSKLVLLLQTLCAIFLQTKLM